MLNRFHRRTASTWWTTGLRRKIEGCGGSSLTDSSKGESRRGSGWSRELSPANDRRRRIKDRSTTIVTTSGFVPIYSPTFCSGFEMRFIPPIPALPSSPLSREHAYMVCHAHRETHMHIDAGPVMASTCQTMHTHSARMRQFAVRRQQHISGVTPKNLCVGTCVKEMQHGCMLGLM